MASATTTLFTTLLLGLSAIKTATAFEGAISYYNAQTGNQGACGGFIQNSDWTVALNAAQYDSGSHCGKSVRIHYQGKTQIAQIRDRCETCSGYGGLGESISVVLAMADAYLQCHNPWY